MITVRITSVNLMRQEHISNNIKKIEMYYYT